MLNGILSVKPGLIWKVPVTLYMLIKTVQEKHDGASMAPGTLEPMDRCGPSTPS